MTTVGIISDTHGLLRPEAVAELRSCDLILHGGDIGRIEVIRALEQLAPVHAVRGNVDQGSWADAFPVDLGVQVEGVHFHLLHRLEDLDVDPREAGFDFVVTGHSHEPALYRDGSVTYLNPGSAGPRRFSLPVSVARVIVEGSRAGAEIVTLEV